MKPLIAYVDDDFSNIRHYQNLLQDSFEIEGFLRSLDLLDALNTKIFDCFVLDIYMPVIDGFQLFDKIRSNPETYNTPVFFVTTFPHDEVKIKSFDKGAADFFDRMLQRDELLARINARIKDHKQNSSFLRQGNLIVNLQNLECLIGNKKIDLTLLEFKILSTFLRSSSGPISKEELIKCIWGSDSISANNVNSHIYNLRLKLANWDHEIDNNRNLGFYLKKKS